MAEISIAHVWPEWHLEEKPLGKGSYGTVYKAVRNDSNLTSYSAIKIISIPQDPSEIDTLRSEGLDMNESKTYLQGIVDNFVNEIQLMQSFKGTQNIVSIEDYKVMKKVNDIGWKIYIRMELLTSLPKYTCDRKMTEADIIKLGCDICSALEMCAQRNIIHRDIKPDNIFINDFGSFKLGDFGIARTLSGMTSGMSQKGTPFYMAPEVFTTNKYDARVDICSLGLVMYKMLNNDLLPFITEKRQLLNPNERDMALERRRSGEPLPKPCEASPAMAHLILKACAHNPEDRFANASELKAALMSVSNGTYKISNPERTSSVRAITTDPNATSGVRPAVQANPKPRGSENSFTPEKPKSKTPKIIAACLTTALLAGGGFLAYPHVRDMVAGEVDNNVGEQIKQTEENQGIVESFTSLKNKALIEAEELVANDDIVGAIKTLENTLNVIGEDSELEQKLQNYQSNHIKDVCTQADVLASEKNYDDAVSILNSALKIIPANAELMEKLNSIKDMQPVLLSSLKPFNGGFEWNNDTTPEDPFGNTYEDYTMICYGKKFLDGNWFDASSTYREYSSEYYIDKKYELLTLQIAPYIDTQEESSSYLEIYADDKKIFTSPEIRRKSQPECYEVDISDCSYLKIVAKVFSGYSPKNSAVIISDMTLWTNQND